MSADAYTSISAIIGSGFLGGLLIGYALKKVVKLIAVIVGLFMAGLAYLQYQQITTINWDRIESARATFVNTMTSSLNEYNIETLGIADFGIPLTSSMSAGFSRAVAGANEVAENGIVS